MRSSDTHCPHSKPLTFGNPQPRPDEKLEFVEHVLGLLIESRFGPGHGYRTLGETRVTAGHSQLFANVRLLTEAEIEAHLNSTHGHSRPSLLCGCLCELCVGKRTSHAESAKDAKGPQRSWDVFADSRTLNPPAHAGGSPSRGSPTFLGRVRFASSFANLASEKRLSEQKQFLGRATDTR